MDRRTFVSCVGAFAGIAAPGMAEIRWHRAGGGSPRAEPRAVGAGFRYLDLDRNHVYSRPCFAGDGTRIVYMRAAAGADPAVTLNSDASPWRLWSVGYDGRDAAPFFEDPVLGATRPDRCPVTGRIAFTGIRDGRAELWLLDADGRHPTHIPVGNPPRTRLFYPSWYPSGNAIAVTDYATREILRVDVASGRAERLTDPAVVWAGMCSVSPDDSRGNPVAFAGQPPGGRYDAQDNGIWIRYSGAPPVPLGTEQGRTPSWSPSGTVLAFASQRARRAPSFTLHPRTLPGGTSGVFLLHVPDRDAGGATLVGPYDVSTIHPKWSPDGAALVCMAEDVGGPRRGLAVIELPPET